MGYGPAHESGRLFVQSNMISRPDDSKWSSKLGDPSVNRIVDHYITLQMFDGFSDLNLFLKRFESTAVITVGRKMNEAKDNRR